MSNEYIKHDDVLDVRDIEGYVREAASVVDDHEGCTEDEREEAAEALKAYADAFNDLTNIDHGEDWEALADAWESLSYTGDAAVISATTFVQYTQQLLSDIGVLPDDIPEYVVINWEDTAENIKDDYTEFELDGVTYLNRLG